MRFIAAVATILSVAGKSSEAQEYGEFDGPKGWLADHNYFRCRHGGAPLEWDRDLAAKAQAVADGLAQKNAGLKHSDSYGTVPYAGENLSQGPTGEGQFTCNGKKQAYGQHCVVWGWWNEYNRYWNCQPSNDFNSVSFSNIGHFTAMIWKGINLLGCASNGQYHVCHYSSKLCKSDKGSDCTQTMPPGLPNFNAKKCPAGQCVDCSKPELEATCKSPTSGSEKTSTTPSPTARKLATPNTTTTPTPTAEPANCSLAQRAKAHAACEAQSKGSWCKLESFPPTCQGTDMPCGC